MKTEEPLVGHEIKVSVKVEETPLSEEMSENDGEKEGESKEDKRPNLAPVTRDVLVTFVDQSHVLFFSQFTPVFFKPGLSYVGQVRKLMFTFNFIKRSLIISINFTSGLVETSRRSSSTQF